MSELKKLTPFKYFTLTNFPYIEADFDALTNYELFCKIVEYINSISSSQNDVIDAFNEFADGITEEWNTYSHDLTEEWNEYKAYVDSIKDDLQGAVNTKLDEMAIDGSLEAIIAPLMPDLINNWLDNHPEATTTVQDKSLTISKFTDELRLQTINDYVTPEMFGYEDGDDLGACINNILSEGYYNIKLYPKTYTLRTSINITDIIGGRIEGAVPISTEEYQFANTPRDGDKTIIECSGMNNKSAIIMQGCMNFNLCNFCIRADEETDSPSVGIYLGRTTNHHSSHYNNISGIGIVLPHSSTLNNNNGTIGIYNNAAEEFITEKSSICADIGIVNTSSDCYNLASALGGENITGATCTVIFYRKMVINAGIAFVNGNSAGIIIKDTFIVDLKKELTNSIILKGDFTNSINKYWNDYHVEIYAENMKSPYMFYFTDPVKIIYSDFNIYYAGTVATDGAIKLGSNYVMLADTFDLKTSSESDAAIADFSATSGTITRCIFKGKPVIPTSPVSGAFGYANRTGVFGFSQSVSPNFPFAIANNISIGAGWGVPSATDVAEGSISFVTNPDSIYALYVFRNGTWTGLTLN